MYKAKTLSRIVSQSIKSLADSNVTFTRNLFAANALGLENYVQARERTKFQIPSIEKFKAKMEEFVKDENSKNLIFTEDLKNMVHIAQPEDNELLIEMIKRFCSQSKEVRFGNFIFGPPIMRYFYHIKDSETALKLFKDESLGGFFDQIITYQILLDLLFEEKKYQTVLDTFDVIQSRQLQGAHFPKHALILVFASCYKLNTKESFEYAKKLWHSSIEAGHIPLRRCATFFSALAIKQDQSFVSLEVLSNLKGQSYISVRALKVLALANMKRFEDIVPILRSVLDVGNPMMKKQTIPKDILEQVQKAFEDNSDKDLQSDFEKIVGFLNTHGHIAADSMDAVLCSEIQLVTNVQQEQGNRRTENYRHRDYDRSSRDYDRPSRDYDRSSRDYDRQSNAVRRPGLHELN